MAPVPDVEFVMTSTCGNLNYGSNMAVGASSWSSGSGGPNALAKVSVSYTWRFINPMLWPFFPGGQITFNVESSMKNEGAPAS